MTWELVPERTRAPRPAARPWWALLGVGVALALVGAALIIWPVFAASRILGLLVGAAFLANGIAALVGAPIRAIGAPVGIMLIFFGAIALLFPEFTVRVLVGFVAFFMLAIGGLWLLIAIQLRRRIRARFIAMPALVVALGLVAVIFPAVALTVAALAAGVATLFIGVSLIWGALALRRASA